ncbi:tuzin [Leishmania donovani]|uniref:Tuzin_-_putative n=3 Tax=Leishmania donovani species complex TaxID=38574 RepID=A0A6L0XPH1_LEIIN|nr:putative tuzin [Leishmania infantum JPCM5]XP_003864423.1 tuzin, putative [Leishmania donovani]CAC9539686.1 tuzin_-_putative [Leishmania infantum]CAJ1992629.1 tuzin [Leishmania donovani]CAM71713.1 putative tuzin [Leishmania infantum JPCM5]CBZ37741.1 tuzin, putative [Leishmania donovani]SUZ45649.1 tuzin_-_putative [Leishmania infantum]|eukprot:XP_001468626.1 putative tuzin [Leishmania infantum JPCM5]
MAVNAFFAKSASAALAPIAKGSIKSKIAGTVYAVHLQHLFLSPIIEVGSRVYLERDKGEEYAGTVVGGTVVRVNGNGTYGVLLDNNSFDMAVPADMVVFSEGRGKLASDAEHREVVEWLRRAGVARRAHQESIACALFHRGWRAHRLYLLQASDVHCVTHIPKAVRMRVLDEAESQRDHHRQMRQLLKERVMERDFRYKLTKYSGVVSASMALLGIAFAFGWNVKNSRTQKREHQLKVAVKALMQTLNQHHNTLQGTTPVAQHFVRREKEESAVRQALRRLDVAHPRIIVFTGFRGCGKSTLCRNAVLQERVPAVYVDIRGTEDTLRSVVKALGVNRVEVCGDLLEFVADSCRTAKATNGETPLLVLKLREGSNFQRVYNDAVALGCDRRLCHVAIEVPIESLSMATAGLPRLDFCMIAMFSREQAFAYTQHTMDAVGLNHFIDIIGTNSNDLDELFAAVHQRRISAVTYTNEKLLKAMRQLQTTCAGRPRLRSALQQLSAIPYGDGQHAGGDAAALQSAALGEIVFYDPVQDAWLFRNKLFHSASRCCWPQARGEMRR